MTRISLIETAHRIVRQHLQSGSVAIDATIGNGHDTLFLAQCVGDCGQIFGFDVQQKALDNTRERLQQQAVMHKVTLFHASHTEMAFFVPASLHGNIQAILFNLGYLPGADKSLITQSDSTLQAVNSACSILAVGGVTTVMAYPGHPGGDEETRQLSAWLQQLDQRKFQVEIIFSSHQQSSAPRLFVIRKVL